MKTFRVYDSPFGALRLQGVVKAASKNQAIQKVADKKGLTGMDAYTFGKMATVKTVRLSC